MITVTKKFNIPQYGEERPERAKQSTRTMKAKKRRRKIATKSKRRNCKGNHITI